MTKEKVVIIGAGAVGQSMGYLLAEKGYHVLGFISKSLSSAQAGVNLIGSGIAATDYIKFILEADLILITTPDQVIKKVAQSLLDQGLISEGCCLIHMSGALTSKVLLPASEVKYGRLSLHPLQSVADIEKGISTLPNSFFTIEGNHLGCKVGTRILQELNVEYEVISSKAKPVYHAAACVASNYLVAITNLAIEMNRQVGISQEKALSGLLPLLEGTLNNIKDIGAIKALTGPISRGDITTIERHLEGLQEISTSEEMELYKRLGIYTTQIAYRKGSIDPKEVLSLKEILK